MLRLLDSAARLAISCLPIFSSPIFAASARGLVTPFLCESFPSSLLKADSAMRLWLHGFTDHEAANQLRKRLGHEVGIESSMNAE
jgi:hypothetical protein